MRGRAARASTTAVARLQIDTRAEAELRRLSGGNQQKVVIARWLAHGFKTLLCFDPTRGIDIGTKRQIYALVREIAAAGSAVLLFTSELPEIRARLRPRASCCSAAASSSEMPAQRGRRGDAAARRPRARRRGRGRGARHDRRPRPACRACERLSARPGASACALFGMPLLLAAVLASPSLIHPDFGAFDVQSLALGALPLAFAAAAQTDRGDQSGGIDLSVGSLIAVANVLSASTDAARELRAVAAAGPRCPGAGRRRRARSTALIVVVSRIPDVVVTLTTGFIWGGVALLILEKPGGGAPPEFLNLAAGTDLSRRGCPMPSSLLVRRRSRRSGCRCGAAASACCIYAAGSDQVAAFRSGVERARSRASCAYAFGGLFSAVGRHRAHHDDGHRRAAGRHLLHAERRSRPLVIGGVSLTGGRGGMVGPVLAACC